MALTPTAFVNVLSGGTLLALALALALVTRERAGRLLALYLGLTGAHFFGLGIARAEPFTDAAAMIRAAHVPLYFAMVPLALFASEATGIHKRFWSRRSTLALALALPIGLTLLELARAEPIVVVVPAGPQAPVLEDERILQGRWFSLWMLDLLGLTAAFTYATVLLAIALARETDPEHVAGRALLLSAFAVPAARIVRELATSGFRWTFLKEIGFTGPPPLLPNDIALQVVVAILLTLLPGLLLLRPRSTRARDAGWAALALAVIVSVMVTIASEAQPPSGNIRWIFFALLVTYGALRHGLLGTRRMALRIFERPLAAAAFAVLAILFVRAADVVSTDEVAIPTGIGLAVVSVALVIGISGPIGRPHPTKTERYSIERELGRGAQGRVLLALDTVLHRSVVLKRVAAGEEALREARAAARVSHPSLVAIHDIADEPDGPVLVMEYLPGGTLEERLRRAPLTLAEAKRLGAELADGLDALHAAGLVHGDIKASNVFLRDDGHATLGDFGSARINDEVTLHALGRAPASASLAGVAPETLHGKRPDARADLYGLGALLYRSLTGESYLHFPPTFEDAKHAVLTAPPLLPHARIPPAWERMLTRALAKEPDARADGARGMRGEILACEG